MYALILAQNGLGHIFSQTHLAVLLENIFTVIHYIIFICRNEFVFIYVYKMMYF
jgi:hypothetical protein